MIVSVSPYSIPVSAHLVEEEMVGPVFTPRLWDEVNKPRRNRKRQSTWNGSFQTDDVEADEDSGQDRDDFRGVCFTNRGFAFQAASWLQADFVVIELRKVGREWQIIDRSGMAPDDIGTVACELCNLAALRVARLSLAFF